MSVFEEEFIEKEGEGRAKLGLYFIMDPQPEWQRVVLGILSSSCARTLTSPFDVFKILGQLGAGTSSVHKTLGHDPFPRNVLPLWTANLISCIRLIPYQLFKVPQNFILLFLFEFEFCIYYLEF